MYTEVSLTDINMVEIIHYVTVTDPFMNNGFSDETKNGHNLNCITFII